MFRQTVRLLLLGLVIPITLVLYPGIASADAVRDAQWHLAYLQMPSVAKASEGNGVAVAVVDSGVDASHPDLAGAILPGVDVGGTGDGRTDVNGHGTGIAGLVAARGRADEAGALGIAPKSMILPVEAGGPGNPLIPEAVDWAVARGARVICIALATGSSQALESAIRRGIQADAVIVAGAGNDPAAGIQAPAKYEGVVAVVGVDRTGQRASFSAIGPSATLAAPAVDIVSTDRGGKYVKSSGTSDATAIIAGVAALVRSKFPQLSAREVIHRMTATAIDKGKPGRDDEYGYGIVNPVGALTADVPPLTESSSPGSAAPPSIGAQPQPGNKGSSAALGWLIGAVLLAAAGTGAAIAIRRAGR